MIAGEKQLWPNRVSGGSPFAHCGLDGSCLAGLLPADLQSKICLGLAPLQPERTKIGSQRGYQDTP